MGCNCGDNEFNIEIENNGSCEPTTPIYNISLGNVGVSGFSPKVNFVNETASGFQIQTIDINGEELSGQVPLLSYVTDNYLLKDGSNAANVFDIGNLRINNSGNWITASTLNSKDLLLYSTGATKVYYGVARSAYTEIATIGDISDLSNTLAPVATSGNYEDLSNKPTIPTVGNGTITINQGGVTKGTFTTNQSGNTTIDLDAGGGGGSVSNPIVFTESSTETSGGTTTTTTGTLTLGLETTGDINPALKLHYKVEQSYEGGSSSYEWDEYIIDRTFPATNGGLTATTDSSTGRTIRRMSIDVDGSTLQINGSGKLEVKPNTFVQKSGDTMTGNLVISEADVSTAIIIKDTDLTKGTTPSVTNYHGISFRDKDGATVSAISISHFTNGGNNASLRCYKPVAGSSEYTEIVVGYNSGGNPYAQAPTPSANSNGTNIATTAWVRTYGSSKQDTLTAGDAIDITSNVIGVKIDGTSITLNADGELQSSGSVPSVIDGGNA